MSVGVDADEALLNALRDNGVVCGDSIEDAWVDDTVDRIRMALINAGWREPEAS